MSLWRRLFGTREAPRRMRPGRPAALAVVALVEFALALSALTQGREARALAIGVLSVGIVVAAVREHRQRRDGQRDGPPEVGQTRT